MTNPYYYDRKFAPLIKSAAHSIANTDVCLILKSLLLLLSVFRHGICQVLGRRVPGEVYGLVGIFLGISLKTGISKDSPQVKKRLSAFPAKALQNLGLLIAFVLLLAASGFVVERPVLTAVLVFVFSLPYLVVSVATKRASFLYATMLLGAVSYFMACHALGAPGKSFPLLSVPLVAILLGVGHHLRKRLPPELPDFAPTVFRAMNITAAVFGLLALVHVWGLMDQAGSLRYVAGLTFLGYAGIYLIHSSAIRKAIHVYAFSLALTLGSIFTVAALWSADLCWVPAIASAGVILLVGTKTHRDRKHNWARHFYISSAGVIFVSLMLSLLRWPFLIMDLALGSLLLWLAYGWLSEAVPDARGATMAERVVAKCFFFGSLCLAILVIPVIFVLPANLYIAISAAIAGATFWWITWRRRDDTGGHGNLYALAAVMFTSAGVLGLGRHLPAWGAQSWSIVCPIALLAALAALRSLFDQDRHKVVREALATAAIFPVFFAWAIPLFQGELVIAVVAAGAALAAVIVMALKPERAFCLRAAGPALAGIFVAGALRLAGAGSAAWIASAAAAAVAGGGFVSSSGKPILRGATNLAWLILSVAALVIAGSAGAINLLYAATVIGATSALIAGRAGRSRDAFELFVKILAVVATIGVVVLGPFTDAGATGTGVCLLILSVANWLAWGQGRSNWSARSAIGLFALGSLLVIYGLFPGIDVRLGLGAAVVAALLILAIVMARSFRVVSHSAVLAGHLTGIVLAIASLIQAWQMETGWLLPACSAALAVFSVLTLMVCRNAGLRVGAGLWASFAVLFGLANYAGTPYHEQLHQLILLSLIWLVGGFVLARTRAKTWSMPLYVCATVLAVFCGIVRMVAPATAASWPIFLVSGFVFAALFLILKQDGFAYLLTLSLSLLAYDWVKSSTSLFTQDVLFYLVIGAVVLASAFLLGYIRNLLGRLGTIPIFAIFTRRGVILMSVAMVACGLLVLIVYTLKLTGHPKFCTSCHNMDKYYSSWQHSAHKDVACIQCHYEPGITNTVKGKIEGLVQVVKYVSHAYSTKPHAMISNSSCMRSGCHADMDHSKEMVLFMGQIRFRHDKHLAIHPRGKELNCVSCHGQTVEDEHIKVTKTTCLTCHFYGRGESSVAAGECRTCHLLPGKPVEFMGQSFDHKGFLVVAKGKGNPKKQEVRVPCAYCHSQVTQGDGAVSAQRCLGCHLKRDIEGNVDDQAQFHLTHVSEGHFDCLQCHDEIKHGIRPMEQQLLAAGNCSTCHTGERHSVQEKIYAGTGVPQIKPEPDDMYKAGVACNGCHTDGKVVGLGPAPFTMKLSGPRQCSDCHGKARYGKMLKSWQEETKASIAELQPAIEKLTKICLAAKAPAEEISKAKKLLESARTKLSYVVQDGSFGAHNHVYVSEILSSVEEEIETCQSLAAKWNKPPIQEGQE